MENPLEEFKKLHKFYCGFDYLTKDLAKFVGVSTRTIQRWMIGKTNPSETQIKKIHTYLAEKETTQKSI